MPMPATTASTRKPTTQPVGMERRCRRAGGLAPGRVVFVLVFGVVVVLRLLIDLYASVLVGLARQGQAALGPPDQVGGDQQQPTVAEQLPR